jgi:hypothetical protein
MRPKPQIAPISQITKTEELFGHHRATLSETKNSLKANQCPPLPIREICAICGSLPLRISSRISL